MRFTAAVWTEVGAPIAIGDLEMQPLWLGVVTDQGGAVVFDSHAGAIERAELHNRAVERMKSVGAE